MDVVAIVQSKDSDDVDVKNDSSKDAVFEDCSYQKDDEYQYFLYNNLSTA